MQRPLQLKMLTVLVSLSLHLALWCYCHTTSRKRTYTDIRKACVSSTHFFVFHDSPFAAQHTREDNKIPLAARSYSTNTLASARFPFFVFQWQTVSKTAYRYVMRWRPGERCCHTKAVARLRLFLAQ